MSDAEQETEQLKVANENGDDARGEGPGGGAQTSRPQLRVVEPRTGPTPKRRSSNATSASRSDPDAKLRHKPGQRPHLVHRGQVAVDPKARCVVACLGEQADGHEGDALVPIIERARFAGPSLESLGTDQGYAAERVWNAVAAARDHRVCAAAADDAPCPGRAAQDLRAGSCSGCPGAVQDPGRGVVLHPADG